MSKFKDKVNIDDFSIEEIDVSEIDSVVKWLSSNVTIDANVSEKGLVITLNGQNFCQELIAKVDRWVGYKENLKNKTWSKAALGDATTAGHKTVKNREWFAMADDEYIKIANEIVTARACKKWLENKAEFFNGWHYAFKTFLKRDYDIENLGNFQVSGYNISLENPSVHSSGDDSVEMCGEVQWTDEESS
jgi:hypothetical protein